MSYYYVYTKSNDLLIEHRIHQKIPRLHLIEGKTCHETLADVSNTNTFAHVHNTNYYYTRICFIQGMILRKLVTRLIILDIDRVWY